MESIVSVPIWDSTFIQGDVTENFIHSCLSQTKGDFTLCIIDNASTYQPTIDLLKKTEEHPNFHVIHNETNLGYGVAANQGIQWGMEQGAEFGVILNNDVLVHSQMWLQDFIRPLRDNPKQLIGARVIPDNHGTDLDGNGCIPYAEGWGLAFHKDFVRDVGLFDSEFLAYYEDVDLSVRSALAGYSVVQSPAFRWRSDGNLSVAIPDGGVLFHLSGQTGYERRDFDFREVTRQSRDYFAMKWGLVKENVIA